MQQNEIYNEDCFKYIKEIDDCSVDLILTDPPYQIEYRNLTWDGVNLDWKFLSKEFKRILKENGTAIVFQGWSNACSLPPYFLFELFKFSEWIIWDRIKGRGATKKLVSTREDIMVFTKTENYTFNKEYSNIPKKTKGFGTKNGQPNRALTNVWYDIPPLVPWSKEKVNHPTQKPLALIERLIRLYSNEGETILDPFVGSGTTGIACINMNRNFILIEQEKEYCDIAKERLSATKEKAV